MKINGKLGLFVASIALTSCVTTRMPQQLSSGITKQKEEISKIKELYFDNLNSQLDAIEAYQLLLIDTYEEKYRMRLSNSLKRSHDNSSMMSRGSSGNKNTDFINLTTLEMLDVFFDEKKDSVRSQMAAKREQIRVAHKNFETIEAINTALNDYVKSKEQFTGTDAYTQALDAQLKKLVSTPVVLDKVKTPRQLITEIEAIENKNNTASTKSSSKSN